MTLAYFDCFSGISGDMILGAMVDAGLPPDFLREKVKQLNLPGCEIKVRRVRRCGLPATSVRVVDPGIAPLSTLAKIKRHLKTSGLPADVRERALEVFSRLAEAEAQAHGVQEAHFHEIGTVDTLVDIVGAVAGLAHLSIDRVIASPVHVGSGMIQTAHGPLPIPPPATAILLTGCPIYATGVPGELTTPTGAAILRTVATSFSPLPAITVKAVGAGAGTAERSIPNLLRLWIGESLDLLTDNEVVQIETNIDDMNPQVYEEVVARLFVAGALDVFLTPVIMKRGRPGILLTVLTPPDRVAALTQIVLRETTALGVRMQKMTRRTLERKIEKMTTPDGPVRMKQAIQEGEILRIQPEFRDVKKMAKHHPLPLVSLLHKHKK
jgi:uncharacterized protein (TIGR00299 family) protein